MIDIVQGMFRRDLELAPGAGFRLRRRLAARAYSALLAIAALGWGAFDLLAGHPIVGGATLALAAAFVIQLVQAEMRSWRFEDGALRTRGASLSLRHIAGVHLAFEGRRARAWVETVQGEQIALVEGDEREVRRIADRLSSEIRGHNT